MILADKIIDLRKKAGWSQEELAEKLAVTRQSVSKWEGAQSIPDMDKVVQMSRLFGVTTDYLLKDELEEETPCAAAQDDDTPLRRVTMKQASAYLALRKAAAPKIAIATALCIISPVTLILLAGMSEVQRFPISGNAAAGIGLCVMLVLLAVAVSIFLRADADVRDYRFLEEEPFETEYGVEGMVRQRQREYADTRTRLVTAGVVLCVLAAVPLFAVMCIDGADLLYVGAVGVLLVLVFSVNLEWLPSSGAYSYGKAGDIADRARHLVLPLAVMVASHLWYYAYMIRNKLLDEVRRDYVLLARSKGLGRTRVLWSHCLRNVMPTVVGIMAISIPHVLSGTYVAEAVFNYPGIGLLAISSAKYHDYNLLMLMVLFTGAMVIISSLLAQSINEAIDPRIKSGEVVC